MSNASTKKVFIQIESAAEQEANLKCQRKSLKVLQGVATDKENLTGRPQTDKLSRLKAATEVAVGSAEYAKRKKIDTRAAETQTTPSKEERTITVDDLTNDETAGPSPYYWERLAEKRRIALQESLAENQRLHEHNKSLEEELTTCRQMLEETKNLVEVLKDIINEGEDGSTTPDSAKGDDDDGKSVQENDDGGDEEEPREAAQDNSGNKGTTISENED